MNPLNPGRARSHAFTSDHPVVATPGGSVPSWSDAYAAAPNGISPSSAE